MRPHLSTFHIFHIPKTLLTSSNPSREVFRLFPNLFPFFQEQNLILDAVKSHFTGSKYFIWIHYLPIYLSKFFFNFLNFGNIFGEFKMISAFTGIVFELKMVFEKSRNYKNHSFSPTSNPRILYIYAGVLVLVPDQKTPSRAATPNPVHLLLLPKFYLSRPSSASPAKTHTNRRFVSISSMPSCLPFRQSMLVRP